MPRYGSCLILRHAIKRRHGEGLWVSSSLLGVISVSRYSEKRIGCPAEASLVTRRLDLAGLSQIANDLGQVRLTGISSCFTR
jgi:hypothetical protein